MPDANDPLMMKAGRYIALGTEFGLSIVAGVIVGFYLDEWLGTGPLFLLTMSLAAFGGSVYRMIVVLKRYQ